MHEQIDTGIATNVMHLPAKARVLLAENDADLRELFGLCLRSSGYDVVEAKDGPEALDHIANSLTVRGRHESFDVVVSDLRMPGFSGLHLLATLRHWLPTLPMILTTGFVNEEIRGDARRLGASALLSKPFPLQELTSAIEHAKAEGAPDYASRVDSAIALVPRARRG